VLLCTDGLHGVAGEEELRTILASNAPLETKCHELIEAAKSHGGPDNITAVLLKA
jgi:PPM family protein phosphatase